MLTILYNLPMLEEGKNQYAQAIADAVMNYYSTKDDWIYKSQTH